MCIGAIALTVAAWFAGLLIDANLDLGGGHLGFLCLRILFPILVMGGFVIKAVKNK